MGRAEAFAMQNPPGASFVDGIGNGLGYSLVLLIVVGSSASCSAAASCPRACPCSARERGRLVQPQRPDGARAGRLLPHRIFIWILRTYWKPAQVEGGGALEHYLSLATKAIFVENMALAFFLGMCSFLAVSKKVETAIGLGIRRHLRARHHRTPLNQPALHRTSSRGRAAWVSPGLATSIWLPHLPDAHRHHRRGRADRRDGPRQVRARALRRAGRVPAADRGQLRHPRRLALHGQERDYNLPEATVFGFGSGIGWALAIVALAAIREKMRYSNVPPALRGLGITFIVTGLMAIAFMAFAGIQL
jgi:Na+-transporting NADH:ubiquinone oxidoreductase subunit E